VGGPEEEDTGMKIFKNIENTWKYMAVLGLSILVVGCAAKWEYKAPEKKFSRSGKGSCVMEKEGEKSELTKGSSKSRVINYADPELCERSTKNRGKDYLRVEPPEIKEE